MGKKPGQLSGKSCSGGGGPYLCTGGSWQWKCLCEAQLIGGGFAWWLTIQGDLTADCSACLLIAAGVCLAAPLGCGFALGACTDVCGAALVGIFLSFVGAALIDMIRCVGSHYHIYQ